MLKGCLGDDHGLGSVTVEDEVVRKRGQFLLYSLPFSFAKVFHFLLPGEMMELEVRSSRRLLTVDL